MSEIKRIAQIVIPKTDNNGKSLTWQHVVYQRGMCARFGGFTAYDARGGWMNAEGVVMQDENVVYHVAMEPTPHNAAIWRDLAKAVATDCEQEAVYVVYASGDVDFVTA